MTSQTAEATSLHGFNGSQSASIIVQSPHTISTRIRHWLCGLNGHERYLHTEPGRLSLRCVGCGHDSPGWDTGRRAYQRTYAGEPSRLRMR